MAWTATELLASIKRRAGMPAAQATFSSAELLAIANEQMLDYVVPLVRQLREDYWLAHFEVPLVDGTTEYPIPTRAAGSALREVAVLDALRNVHNLRRVTTPQLADTTSGFYLQGDSVVLIADSLVGQWEGIQTLRLSFLLRPSVIVDVTAATTISVLDESAGTVTLVSVPAAYTGATQFDIIGGGSPFSCRGYDLGGSLVGDVVTFPGGLPPNVAAGDYVTLPDQAPVPQIPVELHGLLAQKCACVVLESKQFLDKLGPAREELARLESNARSLLTPRVDGESIRVHNRHSLYRANW